MLVRVFDQDPGPEIRRAVTGATLIKSIDQGSPPAVGGQDLMVIGGVTDDGGVPNVPVTVAGVAGIKSRFGWTETLSHPSKGYEGDIYGQALGLQSGGALHIMPVDLAVKDKSITDPAAVDLLVTITRGGNVTQPLWLRAGARICDAALSTATACVATMQTLFWAAGESGAKTVRIRKVFAPESGIGGTPVALSTLNIDDMDTLVDVPALETGGTLTVTTTAETAMDDVDADELRKRYEAAFEALATTPEGQLDRLYVCDSFDSATHDLLSVHCQTMEAQGAFRKAFVAPPVGTSADVATGGAANGCKRTSLIHDQVQVVHPAMRLSRPTFDTDRSDVSNRVLVPGAMAKAFQTSHYQPHQDSTQVGNLLAAYGVFGFEAAPDRATYEQAGICQPIFERTPGVLGQAASFHSDVMPAVEDGKRLYLFTARMADAINAQGLAILSTYHKRGLQPEAAAAALGDWLEGAKLRGEIADYAEPTAKVVDGVEIELTLRVQQQPTGGWYTLKSTFGPNAL